MPRWSAGRLPCSENPGQQYHRWICKDFHSKVDRSMDRETDERRRRTRFPIEIPYERSASGLGDCHANHRRQWHKWNDEWRQYSHWVNVWVSGGVREESIERNGHAEAIKKMFASMSTQKNFDLLKAKFAIYSSGLTGLNQNDSMLISRLDLSIPKM